MRNAQLSFVLLTPDMFQKQGKRFERRPDKMRTNKKTYINMNKGQGTRKGLISKKGNIIHQSNADCQERIVNYPRFVDFPFICTLLYRCIYRVSCNLE